MSEERDMSGTLGSNTKRTKDNHPTHQGKCVIDGKPYWISAWVREGKSGRFFSLAFKPREPKERDSRAVEVPAGADPEFDDDIPF